MKLNVKAMALAAAVAWGLLGMFLTGLANMIWGYGQPLLDLMAALYPGYKATAGFGQVIVGTLYGVVDGGVCGAVFAWLYNLFAGAGSRRA